MAEEITLARVVQAGVVPIDTATVKAALQKTHSVPNEAQRGELTKMPIPAAQHLRESYTATGKSLR